MTPKQVFDYVDEIKPNAFSNATKTIWLNEVEGMVMTEVFLWPKREVFEYVWSASVTTPITFPDEHTVGVADADVRKMFRPGGKVSLTGSGAYTGNTLTNAVIQDVTEDGLVFAETFSATGDTEVSTAVSYDGSTAQLLVGPPHSKIYGQYLIAAIDYANGEYDKYQNTMQMFNAFWGEYMRWYARNYRPADVLALQREIF